MKAIIAVMMLSVSCVAFGGEYEDALNYFDKKGMDAPKFKSSTDQVYTLVTRDGTRLDVTLPKGLSGQFVEITRRGGHKVSGYLY